MKRGYVFILIILVLIIAALFLNFTISGEAVLSRFLKHDKFCGRSSYAYCTKEVQCMPSGCGYQLCGANTEFRYPLATCKNKDCYNATRYGLECTCYKNLCQWRNISK